MRAQALGGTGPLEDDPMSGVDQDIPAEAIAALARGSKIEAIKCLRTARGITRDI